jgi:hypothetical protein
VAIIRITIMRDIWRQPKGNHASMSQWAVTMSKPGRDPSKSGYLKVKKACYQESLLFWY